MRCRSVLVLVVPIAIGCTNVDWVSVAETGSPPSAVRFRGEEMWTVGPEVHKRSADGDWEALDMCGQYGGTERMPARIEVAFVGDDVWTLCAIEGGNQVLIRYSGDEGTLVSVPGDGRIWLLDLHDEVVLAGATSLHRRSGDGWEAFAPFDAMMLPTEVHGAGRGASDIYITQNNPGGNASFVQHWDGSSWTNVQLGELRAYSWPYLRSGRVWLGNIELEAGAVKLPAFSEELAHEINLRGLGLGAIHPDGTAFFGRVDEGGVYIWTADVDDDSLSWVGDGPFRSGTWSGGGGVESMIAIDDSTLYFVWSAGAGIMASAPTYSLIEGSL